MVVTEAMVVGAVCFAVGVVFASVCICTEMFVNQYIEERKKQNDRIRRKNKHHH